MGDSIRTVTAMQYGLLDVSRLSKTWRKSFFGT